MAAPIDSIPELDKILPALWRELTDAVTERRHSYHTGTLINFDGMRCTGRTVVLRSACQEVSELRVHTDFRSPKVVAIRLHPEVEWLFYDPEHKIQLRMRALAQIHYQDDLAREAWAGTRLMSRSAYRGRVAPGTPLDNPSEGATGEVQDVERGWENFAVIRGEVYEIDWLHLRSAGHLRAVFKPEIESGWRGRWVEA